MPCWYGEGVKTRSEGAGTMLKDNIKKLRTERGLSQDELAERIPVVRQTVSKWERGTSVPDADSLLALARALNVTASELLGESGPTERNPDDLVLEAGLLKERISQRDRSERIYRRAIALLIVVCVAVVVGACIYAATNEAVKFTDGFEHGFQLQGTWQSGEGPIGGHSPVVSFGFADDDGGVWQFADLAADEPVNGYFERTDDPNVYILQNEKREEVGWAHVTFTSSFGGKLDGLAYVQYGGKCYAMNRRMEEVLHYDQDFMGLTSTRVDGWQENLADGIEGADSWLKEWFTK